MTSACVGLRLADRSYATLALPTVKSFGLTSAGYAHQRSTVMFSLVHQLTPAWSLPCQSHI